MKTIVGAEDQHATATTKASEMVCVDLELFNQATASFNIFFNSLINQPVN